MRTLLIFLAVLCAFGSAEAAEIRYRIVSPIPTNFNGVVAAINRSGDCAGTFQGPSGTHAFLYTDHNGFTDLGSPVGGLNFIVTGLNDAGQIAAHGLVNSVLHAFRYTPQVGFVDLGAIGARGAETTGINNSGQIAGTFENADGSEHAFRYNSGIGTQDLGVLAGDDSAAYGINERGWVTGVSATRAFLYKDDVGLIDIGPGLGYGLNDAGLVVGTLDSYEPVLYRDGQVVLLGGHGGAVGINNSNVVVGTFDFTFPDGNQFMQGFVWSEDEGMLALNTLFDPSTAVFIAAAGAINDNGQIVGWGFGPERGPVPTGFRLDPVFPIVITNQPADQFVFGGQDASFTVGVTGTTPTFQWRFNDAPIPGATNSTLQFQVQFREQAGAYDVVVSNLVNVVTSSVATLTYVDTPPVARARVVNALRLPSSLFHAGTPENLVLSANRTNATVIVDAALSTDADGDALAYAVAQVEGGRTRVLAGPGGSPMLSFTSDVTGTNGQEFFLRVFAGGQHDEESFAITVLTLADAATRLSDDLDGLAAAGVSVRYRRQLEAALARAARWFDRGKTRPAIASLRQVQFLVRAQRRHLGPQVTQAFLDYTEAIITAARSGR